MTSDPATCNNWPQGRHVGSLQLHFGQSARISFRPTGFFQTPAGRSRGNNGWNQNAEHLEKFQI